MLGCEVLTHALQVCIIGDGVFKFFRLQEGTFKGIPNQLNKMREAPRGRLVCQLAWKDMIEPAKEVSKDRLMAVVVGRSSQGVGEDAELIIQFCSR